MGSYGYRSLGLAYCRRFYYVAEGRLRMTDGPAWVLVLFFLGANNQPITMTAIPGFDSGFACNEAGQLFIARGPGKKGFQCLPMGSDESPKDGMR